MALNPTLRRSVLGLALLLLLVLTWTALAGGLDQLPRAQSSGQKAQTLAQIVAGLLGLLCIATTFWARPWRRRAQASWVFSVTLASGLPPVVWGGASPGIGLAAGGAGLLIALAITWLLRVGLPP